MNDRAQVMKPTLQPGLTFSFAYQVPPSRTVPHLYPESHWFQSMPQVFATGYMVGLVEWAGVGAVMAIGKFIVFLASSAYTASASSSFFRSIDKQAIRLRCAVSGQFALDLLNAGQAGLQLGGQ